MEIFLFEKTIVRWYRTGSHVSQKKRKFFYPDLLHEFIWKSQKMTQGPRTFKIAIKWRYDDVFLPVQAHMVFERGSSLHPVFRKTIFNQFFLFLS